MSSSSAPAVSWRTEIGQAGWIAERLRHPSEQVVASIVPDGFDAYVRILHPVDGGAGREGTKVRWSEVASWGGHPLERDSQFHAVALRLDDTESPPPWNSQGPPQGSLEPDEAAALIDVLRRHTSTPARCWFCIWDGYGWQNKALMASSGQASLRLPDPIPSEVREGPRVKLPWRDYFLYSGPIDAALAFVDSEGQTPNLFWPEDRSWCVASEIDSSSTYVGGSPELCAELLRDGRIEALAADPTDDSSRVAPWVAELVASSVDALILSRRVIVDTAAGIVYASLGRSRFRRGTTTFLIVTARSNGARPNRQNAVRVGPGEDLRARLIPSMTRAVVDLVG
jgi:hypothetical protein